MPQFNKITWNIIQALITICAEANVLTDVESLHHYGHDETEDFNFPPEVVVKPETTEQVSQVVRLCNQNNIPVTARGAGTGLSGGALAVEGGICLSLERMNRILEIDEKNLQATVQPGVINEVFQQAVKEKGLFYPPDPASKGSCFLGGNLAENAGGPKAVKYGVTKDYVLNLQVVLASGEVIWTGANTLKNATGYNLTQLMIGSEGTLGIITQVVFRLIPHPQQTLLLLAAFTSATKACEAVSAIFRKGITPSGMEFMERDAIDWVKQYLDIPFPVKDEIQAHLLIEVDGNYLEQLYQEVEIINTVLEEHGVDEVMLADSDHEKDRLWQMRRKVAEAVHANSVYKEEDTVVPRYELPRLLSGVKEIGSKYGFRSVCYGHAGDGNLHVNIIKGDLTDEQWNGTIKQGIREIFQLVVSLGGTLSGEHGIGYVQKEFMDIVFDKTSLDLMRAVKDVFDPKGVLNPGKVVT
ncbi:MAG: FAD-linked oxidase C-terminal domain-containing protein [Bacteroidia bacterium]